MKKLTFLMITLIAFNGFSQDRTFDKLESLSLGQSYSNALMTIKFDKVLTDSRCPKNVMCVRAGEAKVLVSVYEDGKFVTKKELIIDASNYISEENNSAFVSSLVSIYAVGLYPYPTTENPIPQQEYRLKIGTEIK